MKYIITVEYLQILCAVWYGDECNFFYVRKFGYVVILWTDKYFESYLLLLFITYTE